jgi:hypothetical protein
MNRTPTYLTVALKEQLAQLIKRMPDGEEIIVSNQGIKWKKNGEEQDLRVTSRRQPTDIDEYLDEFRNHRGGEVELPRVLGNQEEQVKILVKRLRSSRSSATFEYHYLLGKLLKDYPTTVGGLVLRECQHNSNISGKIIKLAKRTEEMLGTAGLSYLSLQKLRPRHLRDMSKEKFERLMVGIREIVDTSSFLDSLLGDLTFPVSQELNVGAEVMSPEYELDLNSLINDPIIPE